MSVRIVVGGCLASLRAMPDASVHCCVTSPPYWGLRDYGVSGQLGLESTPQEYVEKMVAVFREVHRVLRDDGTLWLNLGDSYARAVEKGGSGPGNKGNRHIDEARAKMADDRLRREALPESATAGSSDGEAGRADRPGTRAIAGGLKSKDLVGIPWRVAFALQADGWYLRQDIIWAKPNPMPESVRDRCTKSHEYIFLLSKSEKYYYDCDAIAEPFAQSSIDRLEQPTLEQQEGSHRVPGKTNGTMKAVGRHLPGNKTHKGQTAYEGGDEKMRTKAGLVDYATRQRESQAAGEPGSYNGSSFTRGKTAEVKPNVGQGQRIENAGRNKRSVWTVTTQPFKEAHFATFPPKLIEPCILAGCPIGGTVLDPFGGAGTTGLVAQRHGRDAILCELNPDYVKITESRLRVDREKQLKDLL